MCNLSKGVEERGIARGMETGTIKCDSEFDGNPEADSRAGDGGIEGTGGGKSEVRRDAEGMILY